MTLDCDIVLEKEFLNRMVRLTEETEESVGMFQPKILNIDKKTIYSCGIYLSNLMRFHDIGKGKLGNKEFNISRHIFGACSAAALYNRQMLEEMLKNNIEFSYIAQAVCAGFGPIGIYKMFSQLTAENILKREDIPQFLGVQQKAVSPMVRAWKEKRDYLSNTNGDSKESPIEPALYNKFPSETYPEMYKLLTEFGGKLISVSKDDYHRYSDTFISYLLKAGLELTEIIVDGKKDLLEKAGVIAGGGVLKSIEVGLIKKKTKVLCCFTGGIIKDFIPLLSPKYEIKKEGSLEKEIKEYIKFIL